MSLPLDLSLLESDERFQQMCFRLASKEYPSAIPVAVGSWDRGRDVILFGSDVGDVVWQCKFTRRNLSQIKSKIVESLDSLDPEREISKWILCLSVDATGAFLDWLRETVAKYHFIRSWEVWGRESLLERLEKSPDVLEMFFYPVWKALEVKFRTEELELIGYELDPACGWKQLDRGALQFAQSNGADNDLLIDVIVRSRGTIQSLVHSIRVELSEVRRDLRGLPGTGLLWPQYTYTISLAGGMPGTRVEPLEPPVLVDPGAHQRFKVKCTDTGYAWRGFLRLAVLYGDGKELVLPWTFLTA